MTRSHSRSAYSLLTVLMLLTLLGIAVSGLMFFITQSAKTSGAMLERRRVFYACDGMSRQLMAFTQAFLARNTAEDVDEVRLRAELQARLPTLIPDGFTVTGLDVPVRPLPFPIPIEAITSGPFAGLQAKIQIIDIGIGAKKASTGAVCRTEQSLSLGRIALFQLFVFADVPLLDLVPTGDESMFMRGRIHTNGRVCMGGGASFSRIDNLEFPVRLDSRVTSVDQIHQAALCSLSSNTAVGIISGGFPGEQVPGEPDRLGFRGAFTPLEARASSGCLDSRTACQAGWRSFAVSAWGGRVQDKFHTVPELTLPVSPPAFHVQKGIAADGRLVEQDMSIGPRRPNTRFLVEPQLTNDPTDFGRNKLSFKSQIRIIDGVWYLKDPGDDPTSDADDGPWPGIPIWSDHPGTFTLDADMTAEGVEGALVAGAGLKVGQSDIRADLEARAASDPRFANVAWSNRVSLARAPTPRRFSYYAFVDPAQALTAPNLRPDGAGLQYGRVCDPNSRDGDGNLVVGNCDTDPPAVISYGTIAKVQLTPAATTNQTYWTPGFRFASQTDDRDFGYDNNTPWCGGGRVFDGVGDGRVGAAAFLPIDGSNNGAPVFSSFPVRGAPLPGTGSIVREVPGGSLAALGRTCANDSDGGFNTSVRRRARLALLEGTRGGIVDTNVQGDSRMRDAQGNILPVNFDVHAFQEALADRTPGELGSYFCRGCLFGSFTGTVFITSTWRGSMLGGGVIFPGGESRAIPNPQIAASVPTGQPTISGEHLEPGTPASKSAALPYPLCGNVPGLSSRRILFADESTPLGGFNIPHAGDFGTNGYNRELAPGERGSFTVPPCSAYSLTSPANGAPLAAARPTSVRVINARTINFNESKCGPAQNQPCLPRLSPTALGQLQKGLNVITNMPAYVVGDVNQTSEMNNIATGEAAPDWIPFLIGADTVTTLSNSWSDFGSRWAVATDDFALRQGFAGVRPASSTRYTMLLATGINVSSPGTPGGGLPGVMRLMEDWNANFGNPTEHVFRGSIVIGWNPVYTKWRVAQPRAGSWRAPLLRDWQFDRHLNATVNQPPDSPVFDVSAVRSWRRE